MTSPEDSNLGQRWWTANHNIPIQRCGAVGFLRLQAEEDVNEYSVDSRSDCPYSASCESVERQPDDKSWALATALGVV